MNNSPLWIALPTNICYCSAKWTQPYVYTYTRRKRREIFVCMFSQENMKNLPTLKCTPQKHLLLQCQIDSAIYIYISIHIYIYIYIIAQEAYWWHTGAWRMHVSKKASQQEASAAFCSASSWWPTGEPPQGATTGEHAVNIIPPLPIAIGYINREYH